MSIVQRTNPLNLQYRICIVTGAVSPLGTIICKTLLKADAFVFAVDMKMKDDSLNTGLGMHFQFERGDLANSGSGEQVIEAVIEKFRLERLDILVNVVEEG
jgi:NAD(P)-dependent dehydrogenase (short-subunit alcohol dehydrogenase family)